MEPLVTMTGRVGHHPELRSTRNGIDFTRFRVAHTPRIQRENGWEDGDTSWVTVLCYRDLAANVCRSVRRGDPVLVTGRVRVEAWVDDDTKAHRESVTIDARSVGHDLSLGASTFMRIRRDRDDDAADAGSEGERTASGASGEGPDDEAAGVGVPDSLEGLVEKAPF